MVHEQTRWKILLMLAISLIPLIEGKDANWDFYNYHLYVAHALIHGRMSQDFMAASAQGFLNPVLYLPMYWMVMADWHSVLIRLVLAAAHSLNLLALWLICERIVFPQLSNRKYHVLLAVLLGASAPVFLATVGTTFVDPTTSILVLFGLLLLCREAESASRFSLGICGAGLLLGMAAGFKPTNAIYTVSAAGAMLVTLGVGSRILIALAYFGIAAAAGWLIAGGWWAWELYAEFGNPFFPMFNNLFRSPDFPSVFLTVNRYAPNGIYGALAQIFRIAYYHSWIYVEAALPDLRPAVLAIFSVALFAKIGWQRLGGSGARHRDANAPRRVLLWFFAMAAVLWLATSGNGRYGIPIFLLAGPILVWAIARAIPDRRWALLTAATLLIAQNAHAWDTWIGAWDTLPWSKKWLEVAAPAQLREKPYLYFTTDLQTDSFVVPFVHPGAAFVNLFGQYPIPPAGPGSDRVKRLITQHSGRLRTMARIRDPIFGRTHLDNFLTGLDEDFSSWGLRTDRSDCVRVEVGRSWENLPPFLSCALQPGTRTSEEYVRVKERLVPAFGRVQDACPLFFSPPGWRLERRGGYWYRRYLNTDIVLYSARDRMFYSRPDYGPYDVDIGSVADWKAGKGSMRCDHLPPRWSD